VSLAIEQRPSRLPLSVACQVLGLNRSSVYQRRRGLAGDKAKRCRKQAIQPRALSVQERQNVRDTLRSEEYRNQPPAEVRERLLEKGEAPCSVSTMHRILREQGENGERRNQRPAQHHAIPRLKATSPNHVWTWDITKLALVTQGVYLSLYALTDLFSRYTVAWMVSLKENSALAMQLMDEASARYRIQPGQLTLHQDRGSPMTANGFLGAMRALDITCSHSRPRVSNDNPFSESGFKTLKYQSDYPGKFSGTEHARQWCSDYYQWANFHHHHSGLNGYTPEQVFTGSYQQIAITKQQALDKRYTLNPERFVKGRPMIKMPPTEVVINPISAEDIAEGVIDAVNFPTLHAAGYQSNAH
jgi:putative transposase